MDAVGDLALPLRLLCPQPSQDALLRLDGPGVERVGVAAVGEPDAHGYGVELAVVGTVKLSAAATPASVGCAPVRSSSATEAADQMSDSGTPRPWSSSRTAESGHDAPSSSKRSTDPNWASPNTPATGYAFAALVFWLFCFGTSRSAIYTERRLDTGYRR